MSYSVRHQVFVSSTFTDLKEERAEVIQALWEMDCIPTGMEAFVASNESQWSVITSVIDECDYYVLIIGGRYGSVTSDGISYTEKEYRYAKKLGIPVLAFVHAVPESIPVGKADLDEGLRRKLDAFRTEVMNEYPIRSWQSPAELGGLVSRSLLREIKVNPRPGWIRNDGTSPIALLERIDRLTEENSDLRQAAEKFSAGTDDVDLESGNDTVELYGQWRLWDSENSAAVNMSWQALTTWDAIWRDLGTALISEAAESRLTQLLSKFYLLADVPEGMSLLSTTPTISNESWGEVLVQFRALGFMTPGTKKRGVADKGTYWAITPKGDQHLIKLMARRKKPVDK